MRICVIGNSHAAAIKEGWDRIAADHPGVAVQFFAAPGDNMDGLKLFEGRMVATEPLLAEFVTLSSGGQTEIRPEAHDLFLIVGLGLRPPKMDRRLSAQVYRAVTSELSRCLACRVAGMIRMVSEAPILMLPNPLPARQPTPDETEGRLMRQEDCLRDVQSALGLNGLQILRQPEETLSSGWTTDRRWSEGSSTLAGVIGMAPGAMHPDSEFNHMNADYGALWLSMILADLAGKPRHSR